ncbi:MAG: hypothetical protein L0Y75_08470, partial [Acidobacteria bacterium]|nr:hypothetical protein [Acidobacteriota bacterium]
MPTLVGVPLISPVEELIERPGGSEPEEIDHIRAPVPPVAWSVCEYSAFKMPEGSDVVVTSGGGLTVKVAGAEVAP